MSVIKLSLGDTPPTFGTALQTQSNVVPTSTTSATFEEYLSMSVDAVSNGIYRVGLSFISSGSLGNTNIEIRLQQDDTIDLFDYVDGGFSSFYVIPTLIEQPVTLTQGVHTFDVDFRLSNGFGSATMQEAELILWRISP